LPSPIHEELELSALRSPDTQHVLSHTWITTQHNASIPLLTEELSMRAERPSRRWTHTLPLTQNHPDSVLTSSGAFNQYIQSTLPSTHTPDLTNSASLPVSVNFSIAMTKQVHFGLQFWRQGSHQWGLYAALTHGRMPASTHRRERAQGWTGSVTTRSCNNQHLQQWSNHLLKAPPPNTATMVTKFNMSFRVTNHSIL
jgi:hypothetical protein